MIIIYSHFELVKNSGNVAYENSKREIFKSTLDVGFTLKLLTIFIPKLLIHFTNSYKETASNTMNYENIENMKYCTD